MLHGWENILDGIRWVNWSQLIKIVHLGGNVSLAISFLWFCWKLMLSAWSWNHRQHNYSYVSFKRQLYKHFQSIPMWLGWGMWILDSYSTWPYTISILKSHAIYSSPSFKSLKPSFFLYKNCYSYLAMHITLILSCLVIGYNAIFFLLVSLEAICLHNNLPMFLVSIFFVQLY